MHDGGRTGVQGGVTVGSRSKEDSEGLYQAISMISQRVASQHLGITTRAHVG